MIKIYGLKLNGGAFLGYRLVSVNDYGVKVAKDFSQDQSRKKSKVLGHSSYNFNKKLKKTSYRNFAKDSKRG